MELVKAGGILGRIVSTNEELGTRELEYFEGVSYDIPRRITIGINTGETLVTKFEIGDKVKYIDGGRVLEVVGYSGTYGKRDAHLPIVFDEYTWGNENKYELAKVKASVKFKEELELIECKAFKVTKLIDLCKRMITKIEELEDE